MRRSEANQTHTRQTAICESHQLRRARPKAGQYVDAPHRRADYSLNEEKGSIFPAESQGQHRTTRREIFRQVKV